MAKKIALGILFLTAACLSLRIVGPWMASAFSRRGTDLEVTYVCTETKEVVRGPVQPEPALNPKTGRRTLMRAVYATQTQQWVPAPPEQVLRQNRQRYASTDGKSPLTFAPPTEEKKQP